LITDVSNEREININESLYSTYKARCNANGLESMSLDKFRRRVREKIHPTRIKKNRSKKGALVLVGYILTKAMIILIKEQTAS